MRLTLVVPDAAFEVQTAPPPRPLALDLTWHHRACLSCAAGAHAFKINLSYSNKHKKVKLMGAVQRESAPAEAKAVQDSVSEERRLLLQVSPCLQSDMIRVCVPASCRPPEQDLGPALSSLT